MATTQPRPRATSSPAAIDTGSGWITYAGILILIGSVLNVIWGIAAIDSANFFVANSHFVIGSLNLWGWISVALGALLFAAGVGIFNGSRWAIWTGIIAASANAIVQLLAIPAYPLWALAVFTLDLLAVYGLITRGLFRD